MLLVVVEPPRVTVTPSYVAAIALEPPKPVPEMVTVDPGVLLDGVKVMVGVTAKVVEAVFGVELESVAETVWLPFAETGTVNVQLNVP